MLRKPQKRSRRSVLVDGLGQAEGELMAIVAGARDQTELGVAELEEAIRRVGEAARRLGLGAALERALSVGSSVFSGADDPASAALALIRPRRRRTA